MDLNDSPKGEHRVGESSGRWELGLNFKCRKLLWDLGESHYSHGASVSPLII